MKRLFNGLAAALLLFSGLGVVLQTAMPVYAEEGTSTDNNVPATQSNDSTENGTGTDSQGTDGQTSEENVTPTVPNGEEAAASDETGDVSGVGMMSVEGITATEAQTKAYTIISADKSLVEYQAGQVVSVAQFITDAEIQVRNIFGISPTPSVDLSTVNFGVPGEYKVTATAHTVLGIPVDQVVITVNIKDTINPVIHGDSGISYPVGASVSSAQFLSAAHITVTDNSTVPITPTVNLSGVNFNVAGVYTVNVRAKDSRGNMATPFQVTVTVGDLVPPVITGNTTVTYYKGVSRTVAQFLADANIVVSDNSGQTITPTASLGGVNFNVVGNYNVTVNATDNSGNHAVPFVVTVKIVQAPSSLLSANADVYFEAGPNRTSGEIILAANIQVGSVLGVNSQPLLNLGGVDFNTVGVYPVSVTAVSLLGIPLLSTNINVHIVDTTKPVISGTANLTYKEGSVLTETQFLTDAAITVTDNTDEVIVPHASFGSSVNLNTPGVFTYYVNATDGSGNAAIPFAITVNVTDDLPPVITGDTAISYEAGSTVSGSQFLADTHVVVSDDSGLTITPTVDLSNVNFTLPGTYTATVSAADNGGNVTTFTVTVTIVDTTAPSVLIGTNPVYYEVGSEPTKPQILADANATYTDNSTGGVSLGIDLSAVNFNAVGSYTGVVRAIDASGNISAAMPVTIIIQDTTAPTINGETALTYEAGSTVTSNQLLVDANIVITDASGEVITPVVDMSGVNFNAPGTYTATVTATDGSGNSATFTITITITDTTAPMISVTASNVSYEVGTTVSEAQVILDAGVSVSDNSGEVITPAIDLSGVNFNVIGTYTATVRALDSSNNMAAEQTITIHIIDTSAPTITGESALTYEAGSSVTSSQLLTDANIVITDASGEVITPVVDMSGVNFNAPGTYIATVSATDGSGNTATFTITITITDTTAPMLTLTAHDLTYEVGTIVGSAQVLNDAGVTVTDNSSEVIVPTIDLSGVNFMVIGTYTATVSASDSSNNMATTQTITIHIEDTTPPIITAAADIAYEAGTSVSDAQFLLDTNTVVTDNSGVTITPSVDLSEVNFNVVGTYTAYIFATDANNNLAIQSVTVTITDVGAPIIHINATNLAYEVGTTIPANQVLTDAGATVTDNSAEPIVPTIDLSGVNFMQVGTYTATVHAEDESGNLAATRTITITIIDTTAPVISIVSNNLTYEVGTAVAGTQVMNDAGTTVTDNSGDAILASIDLDNVSFMHVGSYTATISAHDLANNQAVNQVITINIVDTTAPVISGTSALTYEAGTTISNSQLLTDANIVITDASGEVITPLVDLSGVNFNTPGTYTATVNATDSSGNTATFTITITIVDTTAPVISLTANDLSYEVGSTVSEAQVILDSGATVTDNSGEVITPAIDLSGVNFTTVGVYTAAVRALDSNNNVAIEQTITIHIIDTTAPVVTANAVTYEAGTTVSEAQFLLDAMVAVTDNSGATIIPTADLSTVDFNTVGNYTVMVVATDPDNNMSALPVTVTITDTTAPSIETETAQLTYEVGTVVPDAQILGDAGVTITDNTNETIMPVLDLTNVNFMQIGTYSATVNASDSSGNAATAVTLTINIIDTTEPVIVAASDISYEAGSTISEAQFLLDTNTVVTDNSGETIMATVDLSGVDFNTVGTYNATISATDSSGNTALQTVTVSITDEGAPVIHIDTTSLSYEVGTAVSASQVMTDAGVTVTDNSSETIVPVIDLSGVNFMQVGDYTATVSAEDSSGNLAASRTITIAVVDTTAPVISANDVSYQIASTVTDSQFIADAHVLVNDNSGVNVNPIIDLSAVDFNTAGTYQATITATDASGNQATYQVNVAIIDTEAPTITLTANSLNYEVGTVVSDAQVLSDSGATVSDNSGAVLTPTIDLSGVDFNTVGSYTATVNAVDNANNAAVSKMIVIQIVDTTAPVLTGDAAITYEAGSVVSAAQFIVDDHIMVSDASGEVITPVVDLSGVDFNTPGTYTVTVTATDSSNNQAELTVTVTIQDETAPVVTIAASDVTYELGSMVTDAQVISDAGIVVTDNSGATIIPTLDLSGVDFNTVGTYPVMVSATDASNNASSQQQINIHIEDTVAPVITADASIQTPLNHTMTEAQVITAANISATDASGTPTITVDLSAVDFTQVGTYTAMIEATDINGNSATKPLNIIVTNGIAPVLSADESVTYELGTTITMNQFLTDIHASASDDSGIQSLSANLSSVTFNTLGTYSVTIVATANDGATVEKTVQIIIRDSTAPTLTVDGALQVTQGTSMTDIDFVAAVHAVTTDASGTPDLTVDFSQMNPPTTLFSLFALTGNSVTFNTLGTYPVTLTATDSSENQTTASVNVTVVAAEETGNNNSGGNSNGNGSTTDTTNGTLVNTGQNTTEMLAAGIAAVLGGIGITISLLWKNRKK
ncbi:LapB repeat-containing protein [Culicoidibacter larvae]|uniref:DUF5011 domain-containing protein n=1 Tax=Culicoidibacter larvae TaxID=2579976 RepID=A0A5R8QD11_9FIRM|nr:LapB repeat-containing protein [Culicoidibacter larvae]TLG72992.1 DUF5011 domain-containing protein [Culicoidibacter larvae]